MGEGQGEVDLLVVVVDSCSEVLPVGYRRTRCSFALDHVGADSIRSGRIAAHTC